MIDTIDDNNVTGVTVPTDTNLECAYDRVTGEFIILRQEENNGM